MSVLLLLPLPVSVVSVAVPSYVCGVLHMCMCSYQGSILDSVIHNDHAAFNYNVKVDTCKETQGAAEGRDGDGDGDGWQRWMDAHVLVSWHAM